MKALHILGAVATAAALAACSGPSSITPLDPVPSKTYTATQAPIQPIPVTPAKPAVEQPEATSPKQCVVGQTFTYTKSSVEQASITITKIEKMTGKQAQAINSWNDDPQGIYWIVWLEYTALKENYSPNGLDWTVKNDAGQKYDSGFVVTKKPPLPRGALHVGQKASGTLDWDAPVSGAKLIFQPGFGQASLCEMDLK